MSDNQLLCGFYRSIQRLLLSSSFDIRTKAFLKLHIHEQFEEADSTINPSYKRIIQAKQFLRELESIKTKRNTKAVVKVLKYVYYNINKYRLPEWLKTFVSMSSIHRNEKNIFMNRYENILQLSHTVNRFRSNPELIKSYKEKLKRDEYLASDDNKKTISSILESETFLPQFDNEIRKKKIISQEILLLIKLRAEYNKKFEGKMKLPKLTIDIDPSRFGEPIPQKRINNKKLKQLRKFQSYIIANGPVSVKDIEYFENLDLDGLGSNVKEGYLEFIPSIFCIEEDATIRFTNNIEKKLIPSKKLTNIYEKVCT